MWNHYIKVRYQRVQVCYRGASYITLNCSIISSPASNQRTETEDRYFSRLPDLMISILGWRRSTPRVLRAIDQHNRCIEPFLILQRLKTSQQWTENVWESVEDVAEAPIGCPVAWRCSLVYGAWQKQQMGCQYVTENLCSGRCPIACICINILSLCLVQSQRYAS